MNYKMETLRSLYRDGDDGPMEAKPHRQPRSNKTPAASSPSTPSQNPSVSRNKVKTGRGKTTTQTFTSAERAEILRKSRELRENSNR